MKKFIYLFLSLIVLTSCGTKEDVVYFNGIDSKDNIVGIDSYMPTYHIDDELIIIISAVDAEAAKPFNLMAVTYSSDIRYASTGGRERLQSYIVDSDGNIDFPVLGTIKIAGLNRDQATKMFIDKLKVYIKNPIVNIRSLNYKVTVLGEVARPGTYTATNERITLIEALGMAGDLTIYGERENVLVIHDYDGKKTYTRVNLKSQELFESPVYYLAQNDVVYVEPNKTAARGSKIGASTGVIIASIGILISVATLIVTITNN
ncbi:MAG: polysaccharide biosynthesis/export family protein [Flavobacteriaceae bacterium]|nr:polysaccharide biosynthesis/export family protein [Flavobacteriaceae bacterium]